MTCPTCSTVGATGSRFCRSCGTALSEAPVVNYQDLLVKKVTKGGRWAKALAILFEIFALLFLCIDHLDLSPDGNFNISLTFVILGIIGLPIIWLIWQKSAYDALRFMGSRERTYPGVIRCWIIPFVNLIRPFQLTRDLWVRSASGNRANPSRFSFPPLVTVWWIVCLSPLITFFSSNRIIIEFTKPSPFISAILATIIVLRIQDFQLNCAELKGAPVRNNGFALKWSAAGISIVGAILFVHALKPARFIPAMGGVVSTPEASIKTLADAFNNHDLQTFGEYFDTDSVIEQQYQLIKKEFSASLRDKNKKPLPGWYVFLLEEFGSYANDRFEENRPEIVKDLEERFVLEKDDPALQYSAELSMLIPGGVGAIGEVGRTADYATSQGPKLFRHAINVNYRGIKKIAYDAGDALVTLCYQSSDGQRDSFLTVRMKRYDLHWRVAWLENGVIVPHTKAAQ